MKASSIKQQFTKLNHKSNLYSRLCLFLTAWLAIAQFAPQAAANPSNKPESLNSSTEEKTYTFGDKGETRWYVQGAIATTLDNNESFPRRFGLVGAGLSKFFIDANSVNLELNTIYFDQPGNNAVGLNLALLGRWHFVRRENWSVFIGGGAGVMGTTSDVPEKGASFNFTPQAGVGGTFALKNNRRLLVGLNWHHISHADLFNANPGRDSIMGFVGIDFPR
ncbi:MAG: acyloxyacyl hydrolase [Cyanobacteria bacterium P01_G01_bin.19]